VGRGDWGGGSWQSNTPRWKEELTSSCSCFGRGSSPRVPARFILILVRKLSGRTSKICVMIWQDRTLKKPQKLISLILRFLISCPHFNAIQFITKFVDPGGRIFASSHNGSANYHDVKTSNISL
jgi:hypothetical protein